MKRAQSIVEIAMLLGLVALISLAVWPLFNAQKERLAGLSTVSPPTGSQTTATPTTAAAPLMTYQQGINATAPGGAPTTTTTGGAPSLGAQLANLHYRSDSGSSNRKVEVVATINRSNINRGPTTTTDEEETPTPKAPDPTANNAH